MPGSVTSTADGWNYEFEDYSDGENMNAEKEEITQKVKVAIGILDKVQLWHAIQNGKITFSSCRDGNLEISMTNTDGTGQTYFTYTTANDDLPTWSPNGSKIAFDLNRNDNFEIYVMHEK